MSLTLKIKAKAAELGFDHVGIAPARALPDHAYFLQWLDQGFGATMEYLRRRASERQSVTNILPGAKSVIVTALSYPHEASSQKTPEDCGWISSYAQGEDYHVVIENKLTALIRYMKEELFLEGEFRLYVDTGPILERAYGREAGVGWIGKNTMLINKRLGSFFFLGEILTTVLLDYDSPEMDHCGSCRLCLDACPTQAFVAPSVLDANRCIAYWTIEHRGAIAESMRGVIGHHLFGCDICQEVCPWNGAERHGKKHPGPIFSPRSDLIAPKLEALAKLQNEERFRNFFQRNTVTRTKFQGFLRNIAVVIGNSGKKRLQGVLFSLRHISDAIVQEHIDWALQKIQKKSRLPK